MMLHASMAAPLNEVQGVVWEMYSEAVCTHYASKLFEPGALRLMHSSSNPPCCWDSSVHVHSFSKACARNKCQKKSDLTKPTGKRKVWLQASYETRWVKWSKTIQTSVEAYSVVIAALKDLKKKAKMKLLRKHAYVSSFSCPRLLSPSLLG